jgi:phospholipase C
MTAWYRRKIVSYLMMLSMTTSLIPPNALAAQQTNDTNTTTPIKHVIVIYGENRSFDHLFATYQPQHGETIRNLLSEGIINDNGTPGPNFGQAAQFQATDSDSYHIAPTKTGPYTTLPPLTVDGPKANSDTSPPFNTLAEAQNATSALLPRDLKLLLIGATGLTSGAIDTRLANAVNLPNGPYFLTPDIPYNAYAASPVHRFYQMWQQEDCAASQATSTNPSGCLADLFPWVEATIGAGTNGAPLTAGGATPSGEGSVAMGIYNVAAGDVPYFKQLADKYSISDNYHQPAMGGTGLDSIIAGFGDAIPFTDGKGNLATPPSGQIENPNPQSGSNNVYTEDGFGDSTTKNGGSYSNCSDGSQPGVQPILDYLAALPAKPKANCDPNAYYLLNNYNPGFLQDGTVDTSTFTIPPVSTPSIGDVLLANAVSFTWFGEGWNQAAADPSSPNNVYCNICNPFNYQTKFMTDPTLRTTVNQDTTDFYADLENDTLPAVSFVKPSGINDGHPASSRFDIYEAFVKKVITQLRKHPDLWKTTAVFITVDEGGGYYDSGYVQPLDFFGDGTRIPMIVVSPYTTGGHVNHSYADHVSVLKFIEKNWNLPVISGRSRDNLPNPVQETGSYVPTNSPALDDLMDMFDFQHDDKGSSDHGRD